MLALASEARSGRGRAALVLGEAGIGKTRLVEAFVAAAADAGFGVAWGHCTDAECPAYWPWRQVLGALHGTSGAAFTVKDGTGVRETLFASVASELERSAAAGPTVVAIEDLHWADASSLALLRFVITALPDLPLVLVLTARDDPLELTPAAADALRDLPPAVHRLPIGGLDWNSTQAIVQSSWRNAPTAFVSEVHDRTNGNPFFVQEVTTLRMLHGERPGFAVPPGVAQVLGRRLARLSQPTHAVLAAGAVVGDELDAELLALVTGQSSDEVVALLEEAVRSRLVVSHDQALEFAHPLVRETLYDAQPLAARADLHARVAEALATHDSRRQSAVDDLDAQLASHWRRASGDAARRRAAQHALAAARGAMRRTGYEQAARYFRWALDARVDDRLSVMLELGEALVLAGELTQGRAILAETAALALDAERGNELARAVLAMGGGIGGFEVEVGDVSQIRLLEDALRLLPAEDDSLRAGVLARLSLTLSGMESVARRSDLAREAVGMAQRVDDVRAEIGAYAAYCDAISGPEHGRERLAAADRMLELTRVADDPKLTLLARRIRLVALLEQGQFALVDAEVVAYATVAERLRLPLYLWPVPVWRGMRALMQGQLDLAWQYSEEAENLGRRAQSLNAELMVFALRVAHASANGTSDRLVDRVRWVAERFGATPLGACTLAALAIDADPQLSRQLFERARSNGIASLASDSEWLEAVWQFGELGMRCGELDMAQSAYDALVPYAEVWAIDGIGGACFGVTSHQLGRLAAALGRRGDAEGWLGRALEVHRAARAGLLVAATERALAELGVAAPARPQPGQSEDGDLRRDGRIWHIRWRGQGATVPDSKGMRDLATLLAAAGREVHVTELIEAAGGPPARAAGGDAGPRLDRQAREAYRSRVVDLEDDLAEAERHADIGRAAALRQERDFLAAELAAALGLGGRDRLAGDPHERARKAVAMRIGTALRAIDQVHPMLGRHLRRSVTTGRFCVYRPEESVRWQVR